MAGTDQLERQVFVWGSLGEVGQANAQAVDSGLADRKSAGCEERTYEFRVKPCKCGFDNSTLWAY